MSDQFDPLDKVQRPHQHLLSRDEHRQPLLTLLARRRQRRTGEGSVAPLLRGLSINGARRTHHGPFSSLLSIRKLMHNANYSTILRAMCLRSQSC